MHPNEQLIHTFYKAFQDRDYKTMQEAYHPHAKFTDPVFRDLSVEEVKSMWQMLVTSAKDLEITCQNVAAGGSSGRCQWQAWYTFTATGRKVHNIIDATFEFKEGKIFRHRDRFPFWRWSRMALGTSGVLLGWTPLISGKVRSMARKRLKKFMKETKTPSQTVIPN